MATMVNDAAVQENVIEEMEYDPEVEVTDIGVVSKDGVVTLMGVARAFGSRTAAERAAWRIGGVRDVIDKIVIDLPPVDRFADAEIQAHLQARLDKDFLVPKGRITVSVLDGVVTLTGAVKHHIQREAAREEAEGTKGVRDVINLITIDHASPSPTNIEGAIRKALTRDAQLDAKNIRVKADGGSVTLEGTVQSYAERREAEDAAWRAKGTTEVVNNIAILP